MHRYAKLLPALIFLQAYALEVHYLNPPRLNDEDVLREIVCYRPVRKEQPRIEHEEAHGKDIIHNYGHGSGGWTMGPGSAQRAVGFLKKIALVKKVDKDTPITVIGAGVIGLLTAYYLVKEGYTPHIVAEEFEELTSHNAGGLFAWASRNQDDAIRTSVNEVCIESCKIYTQIAQGTHPDFPTGARFLPAYFSGRDNSDLELFVAQGLIEPAKEVIVDFNNGKRHPMVAYKCPFIDTPSMMQQLTNFLKQRNVTFRKQKVATFDDISEPIVFNCTGLGSRELAQDDTVYPVQGHLIMLKNQRPENLQYMVEFVAERNKITDDGFPIARACYLFPKRLVDAAEDEVGIAGGTFIQHAQADTPHLEEFARVLTIVRNFFGSSTEAECLT